MSDRTPAPAATSASAPALAVRGLECRYGEQVVLTDITFEVPSGQICFIGGGSGCGKSTLLKNVIGLHEPAAGEVAFFGRGFTGADSDERRRVQTLFGVLYQSGALWSSMTLAENVELPLELHTDLPAAERRRIARLKLAQVGLGGAEARYPAELSGGMKKRAGLARALALDPHLVFFDEPSAGLDPLNSLALDELVRRTRDSFGTTIVIVSHELDSIFGIGERLILLDREAKGIVADGEPRALRERSPLASVREFLTRGGGRSEKKATAEPRRDANRRE
jgi:phospholipid/cholesterol/gamma-HCH transport system ATP-binding protein